MDTLKDLFNIVFFLSMSIVAILSYLQARKTLFSPIKTEIFKIQIEEFQEVLSFFNKQSDHDFTELFDFNEILEINVAKMHHSYIKEFFSDKIEIKDDFMDKIRKASHGAFVDAKYASKFFEVVQPGSELKVPEKLNQEILEPSLKLAKWNEYEHMAVDYTLKYSDESDRLAKLASSPILPKELTDLIYEFRDIAHENVKIVGEVLTEQAKEMPKLYSTAEDAVKFNPHGIWNQYNRKRKSFDPVSTKILKFINEYLKINEIMK